MSSMTWEPAGAEMSDTLLERALAGLGEADGPHAEVLDAAYELFCRQGVARTTMDDVARAAGLSRITVYRRLESKETLVEQVFLREFRRYLTRFFSDVAAAETAQERVVAGFVSALTAVRASPLLDSLVGADPHLRTQSFLGDGGGTMDVVVGFVAGQLRRERAAGEIATDQDLDLVAEMMVRVSMSFVLAPSSRVDLGDEEQLATVARRFLVPMLHPSQE